MSRLEIYSPSKAQLVVEGLYKDLERRIESAPPGLCPVDMARAFLDLCHSQTCGKCVPCRIGLGQLKNLIEDVLNGNATMETLDVMEDLAKTIIDSADCAIGTESAKMVYYGLHGFRDDYEEHIKSGRCTCQYKLPVPCVAQCPAHVDIPGYIALCREGRYEDAVRVIRNDNPFPTTCAFICEHPCEARCRRNMMDKAINIRGIKRAAVDFAGKVAPPACAPSTGMRVAVIGGGPGGLSAAYYLQLMGHQVTVYEMNEKLGGMLRYGIPNYRLPKDRLDEDIESILATGIDVIYGKKIGSDIQITDLRKQYDAVLVTIGANTDKKLGVEGENAEGVISAVQFLRDVGYGRLLDLTGQEVCIIGGGNVSMDCVRTAKRMGAKKVSLVYRRREADMTALPSEIEGAVAEGVEILTLRAPEKIEVDENGHVCGLTVVPQMISAIKDWRATVKPSGEASYTIPCTTLIKAIGQSIDADRFEKAGIPTARGRFSTKKSGAIEEHPGIFAGGDCASGPSTVISAIAAGKVIAANIDEYLGYHHQIRCDVEVPEPILEDKISMGRIDLSEREAGDRINDFDGVEIGMTKCECTQESSRCLRCDHYGYGIFKGGRNREW